MKAKVETKVIEEVMSSPLLTQVLDNTKVEKEIKPPPGFTLLSPGTYFVRVRQEFVKKGTGKPLEVYQSMHVGTSTDKDRFYGQHVGNMSGEEFGIREVADLKVYGTTEMVLSVGVGCGGKAGVRMRIGPESRVAIKEG